MLLPVLSDHAHTRLHLQELEVKIGRVSAVFDYALHFPEINGSEP